MKIDPTIEPELTPAIVFLRGQFSLWNYSIPYFSTVMPLAFVAKHFSLIEEIPEAERVEWSLEELFQRDISWERIEQELVKYLKNENQAQFFNALTIALLPKHGHGFGGVYQEKRKYPPIVDDALDNPTQVGGIQLQYYVGTTGAGKIRWDVNEIIAVAVDGQHRLAAIKEVSKYFKPEQLQGSHVPVILVIPHEKVGFVEPPAARGIAQTVSTLRRIFIDLNKNARPVTRTRSILLDDQDIVSVCTRSLIGKRLSATTEDDRLPLAAVDWISGKNKFDEGPFITNILLLHDIVDYAIEIPDIKEWEEDDINKVRKWLINMFGPNELQLDDLMSQVQRCFNQELPLSFLPTEVATLEGLFNQKWRHYLSRLFFELKPYKELLDYGKLQGLHKPEFFNLYTSKEIFSGERAITRATLIKNSIITNDPNWNENKNYVQPLKHIASLKEQQWAFKVVFQRALFRSFLVLCGQESEFVSENEDKLMVRDQFTTRWIEAINALFDMGLGTVNSKFSRPSESFWLGIGIKADDNIDFTMAGSNRIAKWLNAWVCLYCLEGDIPTWSRLEREESKLATIVQNSLSVKLVREGMRKIVANRPEIEGSDIDDEVTALIRKRYDHMGKIVKKST